MPDEVAQAIASALANARLNMAWFTNYGAELTAALGKYVGGTLCPPQ